MLTSATMALTTMLLATSAGPTWTVVFDADPSIPAEWRQDLGEVARGVVNVGDVAEASRSDLQVALECESWGKACAGKIAELMNAEIVLAVEITARGGGAWFSYEVIGSRRGVIRKKERLRLPDRKAAGLTMARALMVEAASGDDATILVVETSIPGARVLIDGVKKGTTPAVLTDVPAGAHELRVEPEAGQPLFRKVEVASGAITDVAMVIQPAAPDETPDETSGQSSEPPQAQGELPLTAIMLAGFGGPVLLLAINATVHGLVGLTTISLAGRKENGQWSIAESRAVNDLVFFYMLGFQRPTAGGRPVAAGESDAYYIFRLGAAGAALGVGIIGLAAGIGLLGAAGGVWSGSE